MERYLALFFSAASLRNHISHKFGISTFYGELHRQYNLLAHFRGFISQYFCFDISYRVKKIFVLVKLFCKSKRRSQNFLFTPAPK